MGGNSFTIKRYRMKYFILCHRCFADVNGNAMKTMFIVVANQRARYISGQRLLGERKSGDILFIHRIYIAVDVAV